MGVGCERARRPGGLSVRDRAGAIAREIPEKSTMLAHLQPSQRDDISGSIAFRQSQFAIENDGSTLLEQAESAGLSPQSGCRMGICHTCTCLKSSGTVRNINSGEISRGEEHIRLCISQAVGDVTLSL